jgi:hypothetical protein
MGKYIKLMMDHCSTGFWNEAGACISPPDEIPWRARHLIETAQHLYDQYMDDYLEEEQRNEHTAQFLPNILDDLMFWALSVIQEKLPDWRVSIVFEGDGWSDGPESPSDASETSEDLRRYLTSPLI